MGELWTMTPYEFKKIDLKSTVLKKGYNYLSNVKIENARKQEHDLFALIKGEGKKLSEYDYQEITSFCPVDFLGSESKSSAVYERIPLILYNIQNALFLVSENKIMGNPLAISKSLKKHYNENAFLLKNKTLLINQERKDQLSKADFEKNYTYKFEFCKMEKITRAIQERDSSYAIFFPAITLDKYVFAYDAKTYIPLYFDLQIKGQKLTNSDLTTMVEQIKLNENNSKLNINYTLVKKPEIKIDTALKVKVKKDTLATKDSIVKKKDTSNSSAQINSKDSTTIKSLAIKDSVKVDTSKKARAAAAKLKRIELAKFRADSIKQREAEVVRVIMDTTPFVVPELKAPIEVKDKRLDNKNLDYFLKQRVKFEEEAKIEKARKEKEAKDLVLKKQQEMENRHLKPEDAAIFDKARYSDPPKKEPKKPASEIYKELFK